MRALAGTLSPSTSEIEPDHGTGDLGERTVPELGVLGGDDRTLHIGREGGWVDEDLIADAEASHHGGAVGVVDRGGVGQLQHVGQVDRAVVEAPGHDAGAEEGQDHGEQDRAALAASSAAAAPRPAPGSVRWPAAPLANLLRVRKTTRIRITVRVRVAARLVRPVVVAAISAIRPVRRVRTITA